VKEAQPPTNRIPSGPFHILFDALGVHGPHDPLAVPGGDFPGKGEAEGGARRPFGAADHRRDRVAVVGPRRAGVQAQVETFLGRSRGEGGIGASPG
jgi:hypothetical protein